MPPKERRIYPINFRLRGAHGIWLEVAEPPIRQLFWKAEKGFVHRIYSCTLFHFSHNSSLTAGFTKGSENHEIVVYYVKKTHSQDISGITLMNKELALSRMYQIFHIDDEVSHDSYQGALTTKWRAREVFIQGTHFVYPAGVDIFGHILMQHKHGGFDGLDYYGNEPQVEIMFTYAKIPVSDLDDQEIDIEYSP